MDVKVIEGRAARVATNCGADPDRILGQLNRVWHRCWAEKTERLTRNELAGIFGRQNLDAVIEALLAEDFICPCACVCTRCQEAQAREGAHRIGGAHKFTRLRKAFSDGGKRVRALGLNPKGPALRPSPDPEIPRSRDPESASPPEIPRSRDPEIPRLLRNAFAEYWVDLEASRQARCSRGGYDPHGVCRAKPETQVQYLADALELLGLTDAPVETWRRRIDDLLIAYLEDEQLGRFDREGKERVQPWPLPVFLNPKVLERFARDADEGAQQ